MVLVGEPDYLMVPCRDDHDFDAAYNAVRLAMVPAPDEMIIGAIGVLEAKCKRAKESDSAGDLGLQVFVSELRKYPADVVLAVLNNWGDRNIFAPSWYEIKTELDRMTQGRRNLLASLEWSSKQPRAALISKPAPERPVDFEPAPNLLNEPRPPIRNATDMAQQLRGME